MRLAITGSTGLIGNAAADYFHAKGDVITRVCRRSSRIESDDRMVFWDIEKGKLGQPSLEGHDAVIHLAGANIAAQRWARAYKMKILDSRINSTALLCSALAGLSKRPEVILIASAVGFYGDCGPHISLDESSGVGKGFLADVCRKWEAAAEPARKAGIRVIHTRFGMALSGQGGALAKMLPVFRWGLGGPIGLGRQMISWVALDEIPLIMNHLIKVKNISGPVNCVSPHPVSNQEFTKVLGKVLCRPAVVPLPGLMVKLLFGEMGETLLSGGQKVFPKKLCDSGYKFQYPFLEDALKAGLQ
jgi:uncharacterized protein (TIGR01777 family)